MPLCGPTSDFKTKSSLTRHTERHRDFLSKPFLCPRCQRLRKISGVPAWARHVGDFRMEFGVPLPPRSNNSQRRLCCPWCEYKFSAFGYLRHYNKKHRGHYRFSFNCLICKRDPVLTLNSQVMMHGASISLIHIPVTSLSHMHSSQKTWNTHEKNARTLHLEQLSTVT